MGPHKASLAVACLIAFVGLAASCAGSEVRTPGAAPAGAVSGPNAGAEEATTIIADSHDTSPALRDIAPAPLTAARKRGAERKDISPHPKGDGRDAALQAPPAASKLPAPTVLAPSLGGGFDGPAANGMSPPDTSSAIGPNHVVTAVNTNLLIQNKAGTILYGPVGINTVFSGFGGACQNTNDGDPLVRFDLLAQRFILTQFANRSVSSGPFYECIAVSASGDPTGSWHRYSFMYPDFPDYPKLGVWPDAYYVTYNMYKATTTAWAGPKVCALDRAKMLDGLSATQQCFSLSKLYGAPLPPDVDSAAPPPNGSPAPMVSLGLSGTTLAYWSLKVNWATPASSTITGPTALTVAAYTPACGGGVCIPQQGTATRLDSLGDRLMNRFAYRNFGDHESFLVSHSVSANGTTGVRWYELRRSGTALSVYQQGTYAPDGTARWMPSIAMDGVGNIAIGYSASSASMFPAIRVNGRLSGDALGTLGQGETTVKAGGGAQTGSLTRWGDYATMSIDPADQCTFWFSTEYLKASGSYNWSTYTSPFKLPGCSVPITPDFSLTPNPTTATVAVGRSTSFTIATSNQGTAQSVVLSASGLPPGATATFNPATITSGDSSTLTIASSSSTPAGTSTIVVTGTGSSTTRSTTLSLTVTGLSPANSVVTNGMFEAGTSLTGWTRSGTVAAITNPAAYSGSWSGRAGSTTATQGDSKLTTTAFTVPTGKTTLSFWYKVNCPDTVAFDWVTATLNDKTKKTVTTILPKTCKNDGVWRQVSVAVVAGRQYVLTLISHDDNFAADPTFAQFDQVLVS